MRTALAPELVDLAGEVEVLSGEAFRLGGREFRVDGPEPVLAATPPGSPRPSSSRLALLRALSDRLYSRWYARSADESVPRPDPAAFRDHLGRLWSALPARDGWEPGWSFGRVIAGGGIEVAGYGLCFRADAKGVRPSVDRLQAGDACRVRVPAERRAMVPGYHLVLGQAPTATPGGPERWLRIYWHLAPAAAPAWVRSVALGLDRAEVAFRLKVVADPRFYLRADAGVLLIEPESLEDARPILVEVHRTIAPSLGPSIPALTTPLAPGVGLAEGDGDGTSFGAGRCELIAEALVAVGPSPAEERRRAIAEAFEHAGLDPEHPYRAPGSTVLYPPWPGEGSAPRRRGSKGSADEEEKVDHLAVARAIGDTLRRRAVTDGRRANWVGRAFVPDPQGGGFVPALGALGPDLYGGTSGVALFLAELFAVTGDNAIRDLALAAIRQALGALDREPGLQPPTGFYEGPLGIVWAAKRVAERTAEERLWAEADRRLSGFVLELAGGRQTDLLAGDAGSVVALVRLHAETGRAELLDAAAALGEGLLAPTIGLRPPALTGLAHGASGLGLALLELFAATGAREAREAAARCFAYEDRLFDPSRRNWPDFRPMASDATGPRASAPGWMAAWCHGAPGIALARLRALELDPEGRPAHEVAARAALATTAAAIEAALERPGDDLCLCHGLTGLAEIAGAGARALKEPALERLERAAFDRVAALRQGDDRSAAAAPARPYDPSLLTGDAGVGHALLRFARAGGPGTLLLPAERSGSLGAERHPIPLPTERTR